MKKKHDIKVERLRRAAKHPGAKVTPYKREHRSWRELCDMAMFMDDPRQPRSGE